MTWLGYKIYIFTDDDEKLFTIRDTEPEKLLLWCLYPVAQVMHASLKSCLILIALSPGC